MGLLDFIEAGPQRRQWLDDTVGDFVEYITPPNLRPAVDMVAQMNPIQGMVDSMSSFDVATDRSRSMDERRRGAINSVVEGLLAVAPAAVASRGYMTPAQGVMESLLGGSPATQQIGDDLGRFVVDEAGSVPTGLLDDYAGVHRAPMRGDNAPLSDLTEMFGDDIYGPNAAAWFGHGGDSVALDRETVNILSRYRGNPDADVVVYRAVPKGVDGINAGDWVTVNRDYAVSHGESQLGGNYDIVEKTVKADEIFNDANSIHEFGYDPRPQQLTDAEAMARDILDLRAAGRASEVTDDMMAKADPQYMFNNTPLDMSQEARMARAGEMGFGDDGYHGSTHVFDSFGGSTVNPEGHFGSGIYATSSPSDASKHYAGEGPDLTQRIQIRAERIADDMGVEYDDPVALEAARRELSGGTEGVVYPVSMRRGNAYDISSEGNTYVDMGFPELDPKDYLDEAGGDMEAAEELARDYAWDYEPEGTLADIIDSIQRNPETEDASRMMEKLSDTGATIEGIQARYLDDIIRSPHALYAEDDLGRLTSNEVYRQALEDAGYQSVRHDANIFRGLPTDPDAVHDIIFNPANIRSRFARFDPAFRHLANLNASVPTKAIPAYTAGLLALGTALHKEKEGGQ